jgi:glycosyltransferase involved in cell wall biosynthesis
VRLLYLADIRFPLERANGIQTIETCHALARHGVQVTLRVRPDTTEPPRDPYAFYGLPRIAGLDIETAATPAQPAAVRRAMYLASSWLRATTGPWDLVLTRDLGMASLLSRTPARERPALVYESHGFAPAVHSEMKEMLSDGAAPSDVKQQRLLAREARVWRRADGYITITRALAVELVERFGVRARLAVVPDGVRLPDASPGRHELGKPPVIAYAGHLYPWKGVDVLLDALSRLPHVRGLIVGGHPGEPDLAHCQTLARDLSIADRVTFTGLVPPSDVAAYLASADIVVLPNPALQISQRYTSPLKLFEYMAAGRAIVAADLPAVREVLDENAAMLVVPGSGAALAEGIAALLDDGRLRRRVVEEATRRVQSYSWDARAARLADEFTHVLEDRRR